MLNVLFAGDIIGRPGREYLTEHLLSIRKGESIDFVIANGENTAGGRGINRRVADELFSAGVDVITNGNHVWDRKEVSQVIDDPRILRPFNYPPSVPGRGYGLFNAGAIRIGVISLIGRVYMPHTDCPFQRVDDALHAIHAVTPIVLVDFHAEITSEKQAMGWYLDGKATAVVGTHTHVPTADGRILPNGTAYITDCGMVGPSESIIGADRELALKRFLTALPVHLPVASGPVIFSGVRVTIDEQTGKATAIDLIMRND